MIPHRDAYSIPEFCEAHGFCRASYYNLPAEDRPREMEIGKLKRITRDAAADWRCRMEEKAAALVAAKAEDEEAEQPPAANGDNQEDEDETG